MHVINVLDILSAMVFVIIAIKSIKLKNAYALVSILMMLKAYVNLVVSQAAKAIANLQVALTTIMVIMLTQVKPQKKYV
jgi:hypothetical protein